MKQIKDSLFPPVAKWLSQHVTYQQNSKDLKWHDWWLEGNIKILYWHHNYSFFALFFLSTSFRQTKLDYSLSLVHNWVSLWVHTWPIFIHFSHLLVSNNIKRTHKPSHQYKSQGCNNWILVYWPSLLNPCFSPSDTKNGNYYPGSSHCFLCLI